MNRVGEAIDNCKSLTIRTAFEITAQGADTVVESIKILAVFTLFRAVLCSACKSPGFRVN